MTDIELERRIGQIEKNIALLTTSIDALRKEIGKDLSETERSKDVWSLLKSKEHTDFLHDFFEGCYEKKREDMEKNMLEVIEKWKNKTIVKAIATFVSLSGLLQIGIWYIIQHFF
jgi:hypothetical protein